MKLDKLMNSPWFVKILALFLALMLYTAVNMESNTPTKPSSIVPSLPGATVKQEELSNIPLNTYYNHDKYAILSVPSEVKVVMEGPSSALTTTKMQGDYEVYIDLNEAEPGTHKVKVNHRGFSDKLDIKIEPSIVTVNIQEKISRTFPVEIEYLNSEQIQDGYTVDEAVVLPEEITVSGAKDLVNTVSMVKVFVDLDGIDKSINKTLPIKAYDKNGNVLAIDMQPAEVKVDIPIILPNKTVPLVVNRKGELKEGLAIQSFTVTPEEVTIYGEKKDLEAIKQIDGIEIDLATITKDSVKVIDIPLPKGINMVEPKTIKLEVDVEPEVSKTLENVPIKVIGLSDGLKVSFLSPSDNNTELKVYGTKEKLQEIDASDFKVILNLSEYFLGEHEVDIEVFGPEKEIKWKVNQQKAVINITNE